MKLLILLFNLIVVSAYNKAMMLIFLEILKINQIVRPGGMERPTDSFKETHNLVLANEDTYFGGLVSNLQVNLYK